MNFIHRYTLTSEEIIPVNELGDLSYRTFYGNNSPWNSRHLVALFRFYVAGGKQDYYDITSMYNPDTVTRNILRPSTVIPADETGYLTAIEMYIVWDTVYEETMKYTNLRYPVTVIDYFVVPGMEDAAATSPEKHRVDISAPVAPAGIELAESENANYLMSYKIVGFDADKAYEILNPHGTVSVLEAGATELDSADVDSAVLYGL